MSAEEKVERFIVDEIMLGDSHTKLESDQSLLSSGILDSLALLRLIAFIEDKFSITVGDNDVTPDNFETLNSITTYLERKHQSI